MQPPQSRPLADDPAAADTLAGHAFSTEPEERIQRSLFGEILDWMLAPLLLLWPMSIAITYLVAKSIANQPFDRALEDRVTVLAQQVKEVNGKPLAARCPAAARDILRADDVDNVYFQVLRPGAANSSTATATCRSPPEEEPAAAVVGAVPLRRTCAAARCASPTSYVNLRRAGRQARRRAAAGAGAGRRNAGQARAAGQRDHQGRDPARSS